MSDRQVLTCETKSYARLKFYLVAFGPRVFGEICFVVSCQESVNEASGMSLTRKRSSHVQSIVPVCVKLELLWFLSLVDR